MRLRYFITLLPGLLLVTSLEAAPLLNELDGDASPYLASHASDPVHWQRWEHATLERARRENKMLFLSSGYYTCYYCHRLRQESFSDPGFAKYVNERFIPVLVDREIEPVLDDFLTSFMQANRQQAGWPMLVMLTPDGHPLVGSLYLGRAELRAFLDRIAMRWRADADTLRRVAAAASEELARQRAGTPVALPREERPFYLRGFLQQALLIADDEQGGFGDSEKYPFTPQLRAMVRAHYRAPNPLLETFLRTTLDNMAAGGLRDHVNGGFFRYTTDRSWALPHFEKMLSINALLAEVYLEASLVLDEPRYRSIAFDTLRFVLAAFEVEGGGYCSSLSAFSPNGVQGGYYLWPQKELREVLSADDYAAVEKAWINAAPPPYPGGYLPSPFKDSGPILAHLARSTETRELPRDNKVIAADNGLLLRVLARAAQLDESFTPAATRLQAYLLQHHRDGEGVLKLATGDATVAGDLNDYALVASGLLAYAALTTVDFDRRQAVAVLTQSWRRFYRDGLWKLSETALPPIPVSLIAVPDSAVPSSSGELIATSLGVAPGERTPPIEQGLVDALAAGSEAMRTEPFFHATQISTLWSSNE